MKIALVSSRAGGARHNSLRLKATEAEWEDLQAAIAHIKASNLPVDGNSAGKVAEILVERGYRGEQTKNTRTTKEWTLEKTAEKGGAR